METAQALAIAAAAFVTSLVIDSPRLPYQISARAEAVMDRAVSRVEFHPDWREANYQIAPQAVWRCDAENKHARL